MEGGLMITETEKICQYIYDLAVEFKEGKNIVQI